MDVREIDLYRYYGHTPPPEAVGRLTVWHYETPERLGGRRTRPGVLLLPGGAYSRTSDREAWPCGLPPWGISPLCSGTPARPTAFPWPCGKRLWR